MSDQFLSIPLEQFAAAVRLGIFSDQEMAEWIRSNRPGSAQQVALTQALVDLKRGPITGIVRTALRELHGLPPVPGDEV